MFEDTGQNETRKNHYPFINKLVETITERIKTWVQLPASPLNMEKRRPIINTLQEFQTVEAHQIHMLGLEQTPMDVFGLLKGEVGELEEAIKTTDRAEVASEIADIMILTTRIASLHDIPLELALSDKLNRNAHKYNPHKARRLQDAGFTPRDSMKVLKALWNRDEDKKFCSACGRAA